MPENVYRLVKVDNIIYVVYKMILGIEKLQIIG